MPGDGRGGTGWGAALVAVALASTAACGRGDRALADAATRAALRGDIPERLAETGLYADPRTRRVASDVLPYSPQYPLWSDGAVKRRWIRIPRGTAIDARDPDRFVFPAGTQLWKEFAAPDGRRIETRHLALAADGAWRVAAYVWNADGTDARRAPGTGVPHATELVPGIPYDVPSTADCRGCHDARPQFVLGFDALQLSPDRDPLALHATPHPGDWTLDRLAARGVVRGLPHAVLTAAPRIAARTPRERAALGYLHGNCSNCHNARGPLAELGLSFEQRVAQPALLAAHATAVAKPSRWIPPGASGAPRIAPGDPAASAVVQRVATRSPLAQMPPFGTHVVDADAVELLTAWVRELGPAPPQATPAERSPQSPLTRRSPP